MGKKINSAKVAPKSKKAITKHKLAKEPPSKKAKKVTETIVNAPIVNFTPDDQSKTLAVYHFLKNQMKNGSLDKTIKCFGKELEELFGAEVVASESTMKVNFEGGSNSKAAKKAEVDRLAKEAEEKAKLAAEALKAAEDDSDDSDSDSDIDSDDEGMF